MKRSHGSNYINRSQPDKHLECNFIDNNETIRRETNYFESTKDAGSYAEYRERGWSSASSEVESAHRYIVHVRLKIPGAWWHPDTGPNILTLRMLTANGWWNEYWKSQRKQWAQRVQRFAAPGNLKGSHPDQTGH